MGLPQFQGVNASTDAQKAALSSMLAAQGSAGAQAFKDEQAVAAATAKAAHAAVLQSNPGIAQPNMSSAVGPGNLTRELAARASEPGNTYSMGAANAANDFAGYTGMLRQANSNYGDAVKGAAPIVESQTRSEVAAIQAEIAFKREQMRQEAIERQKAYEHEKWQRDQEKKEAMLAEAGLGPDGKPDKDAPINLAEASQTYDRLGLNPKQKASIMGSDAYQKMLLAAGGYMENLGENASYDDLAGFLNNLDNERIKQNDGTYQDTVPGGLHPKVKALILARFAPLFGRTGGKADLDAAGYVPPKPPRGPQAPQMPDGKPDVSDRLTAVQLRAMSDAAVRRAIRFSSPGSKTRKLGEAEMQRRMNAAYQGGSIHTDPAGGALRGSGSRHFL
jgi:hypothetical protein